MTALVVLVLKVTLVLAVGLLLAQALRRQAAALRHAVLLAGVAAALLMPVAALVAPAWAPVPRLVQVAPGLATDDIISATTVVDGRGPRPAPTTPDASLEASARAVGIAWVLVSTLALLRLVRDAHRLRALARESRPLHDARWLSALSRVSAALGTPAHVQLRVGAEDAPVVTWGLRHPRVLLPARALSWTNDRIDHVLAHELAHVARRDWAWHLLLAVGAAVYCWHPLMRLAVRQARRDAECACDDAVLATGASASAYATTLVDVARTSRARQAVAMLAMADTSSLERRIAAMLDASIDHTHSPRRERAIGAGLVLAFTLAVAGLSAQAQGTGVVRGTVLPPGGTPIGNVTITFTGASTVTATTDASGQFSATLPEGTYRAEIRLPGFKRFSARVDVSTGATVARDFALALGTVSESISVRGLPASAPVEPGFSRPAPPQANPFAGTIDPPRKLKDVKPVYPDDLKSAGVAGKVVLNARIGVDGHVTDVQSISDAHSQLVRAAVDAVEQWKFAPTLLQGKPVATEMRVTIEYRQK